MPCLCEYADKIFYCAMGILMVLFVAAMILIQVKLGGESTWPTPPKKGE